MRPVRICKWVYFKAKLKENYLIENQSSVLRQFDWQTIHVAATLFHTIFECKPNGIFWFLCELKGIAGHHFSPTMEKIRDRIDALEYESICCYFARFFFTWMHCGRFYSCEQRRRRKKSEKEFSPENDKPFDYLTAFSIPFEYIFWRVLRSLKERTR